MTGGPRGGGSSPPARHHQVPAVTPLTEPFWGGGAHGELRIQRCRRCGRHRHPPAPVCRHCGSDDLGVEVVSGRGVVHTFTVNHHQWSDGLDVPYVIAVVDLDDAPGVRLLTDIVGCAPGEVTIGMPVRVVFERRGDVHLPLFTPAEP